MVLESPDSRLTRIGVFYDGGFFSAVSDYYRYHHPRKARLSIEGIHRFAIHRVAGEEGVDERYCQVVDAHYFRGRFSASDADQRGRLFAERQFEDVLMRSGVVTHYLPQRPGQEEKGIDVWLALEAFELAVYKRFNVLVLIAGDGDYLALIRKLNTLGTRVMLLGWDFEYLDDLGRQRTTRTAQSLLEEVTYPVMMHSVIDDRTAKNDPIIRDLFVVTPVIPDVVPTPEQADTRDMSVGDRRSGTIHSLLEGYGFIKDNLTGKTLFFHHTGLLGPQFETLRVGEPTQFIVAENERGLLAKEVSPSSTA